MRAKIPPNFDNLKKLRPRRPGKPSLSAIIAILLITGGVAFALLQGRGVITGNNISTADATLLVSTDGVNYDQSVSGFNFDGIIPGGYPAPYGGYPVYVKNAGDTDLDLDLSLDNAPSNPDSADLSKFDVDLIDGSGSTATQSFTLDSLIGGGQPVDGDLAPGSVREYRLQAQAADGAAPGTTLGGLDLVFTGTPRDPNAPVQVSP